MWNKDTSLEEYLMLVWLSKECLKYKNERTITLVIKEKERIEYELNLKGSFVNVLDKLTMNRIDAVEAWRFEIGKKELKITLSSKYVESSYFNILAKMELEDIAKETSLEEARKYEMLKAINA